MPKSRKRAHVSLRSTSLYIDVEGVGDGGTDVVQSALCHAAAHAGLAEWILGPFELAQFEPPKCYGRLMLKQGDEVRPGTRLAAAMRAACSVLDSAGYEVHSDPSL
jgi:hypothetical protein